MYAHLELDLAHPTEQPRRVFLPIPTLPDRRAPDQK